MRNRTRLLLLACGLSACQAHVTLLAPRADAPLEERVKAYQVLKPISSHELVLITTQGGMVTGTSSTPSYLQLNGGARVYHVEDLLPVLPPDSAAARAAEVSQSATTKLRTAQGIGVGLGGVALVVTAVVLASGPAIPNLPFPWTTDQFNQHQAALKASTDQLVLGVTLGGAGVALGVLVALVGGWIFGPTAADSQRTVFETYEQGLRDRLGLAAPDTRVPASPGAISL